MAGSVIGARGAQHVDSARYAGDEMALPRIQGVADEAAPLRPPDIAEHRAEFLCDEAGNFILDAERC
jgi:hypothetical protein